MNAWQLEIHLEYNDGGRRFHCPMKIDRLILEQEAQRGSEAVREFLRNMIVNEMINPMLDRLLADLIERERSESELRQLIGSPVIDIDSMESAIRDAIIRRRPE